jgi:hypothetical protein
MDGSIEVGGVGEGVVGEIVRFENPATRTRRR